MVFLALMACILVGVAAYNLTCAFVDVPTSKTSKMMMFAKKQQGIRSEKLHEVYITKIATKLAPFIHLDKLKRDKLQSVLSIAGIPLSPEVYTLRAYVTASLIVLAALLMAVVMPLSVPILIGLAVAMWFSTYYSAFDFVKKRKKVIEAEIPPVRPHHRAESGERPRCAEDLGRLPPCGRQGVRHGAGPDGGRHEDRQLRKCPDPV